MKYQFNLIAVIAFFIVGTFFASGAQAQTLDVLKDSASQTKTFKEVIENNIVNSTTYPYITNSDGTLNTMTTGTTQLIPAGSDDIASAVANIGFTFRFDGVNYTQFSVNSNGMMKLGSTAVSNSRFNEDFPTAITASDYPMLTAYWDDLCTSSTGQVHYRTDGTAPFRRLTVEWQNMLRYNNSCTTGTASPRGTFQVQIFENRNDILFVYGTMATGTTGAGGSSPVGFSVLVASASPTTTGFASVNSATHTVAYNTATNNNTNAFTAGRYYSFAAPVTASGVTISGRIFNQSGKAVSRAEVRFSDMNGNLRTATTNQFGYYQFDEVQAGQTYVFQVLSKGASYAPQVVTANDNVADLNFYAQ